VVVLAERAARAMFGSTEAALGQRLSLGIGWPEAGATAEVVGVVGDIRDGGFAGEARPLVYVDWRQQSYGEGRLVLRGAQPAQLARPLAALVRAQDPEVVVWDARPMSERLAASIARERLVAALLLAFGAIAMLLAAIGVAAVLGLAVEQRRREFGIRLAVGARPRDLLAAVLGDGVATVLGGAALGLIAATALGGVLGALLHGVAPLDTGVRLAALAAIALAGALGAALPAWRAARVDPMAALRHE
jgi:putative ABC transport system permease protein